VEKRFCFKQIASDLAHNDIHPPLYFWLLHLWCLLWGVSLWTGPSLNLLLAVLTALSLFGLARYTLRNSTEAAAVASIWAVSPAVIPISVEARQYDLLGLCTVLLVWQVIRCSDSRLRFAWGEFILLAITTAAGALTHYQFILAAAGAIVFLLVRLVRKDGRRLIVGLSSIAMGYAIFLLLHPGFLASLARQRAQMEKSVSIALEARLEAVWKGLLGFFVPLPFGRLSPILVAAAVGLIFWFLAALFHRRAGSLPRLQRLDFTGLHILFFPLWLLVTIVSLYLASVSPGNAMGGKYLGMLWPFFAFLPIFIFRPILKFQGGLMAVFCLAMLLSGARGIVYTTRQDALSYNPPVPLEDCTKVMVDNVARGILPRVFWHMSDDSLLFAAPQKYLLGREDLWLSHLAEAVYISSQHYGGTPARRQQILSQIGQRYLVIPVEGAHWDVGSIFLVREKEE